MKKTAENDFNKAVECIVKSDFYNDLNKCLDMVKLLDKNKELQERIEDLNIINEEHKILNGMIRKELQQKENIIKEVREYITSYESIETIQQFDHNKNNKDLDYSTIDEMTRRYMIVHDKILKILEKEVIKSE